MLPLRSLLRLSLCLALLCLQVPLPAFSVVVAARMAVSGARAWIPPSRSMSVRFNADAATIPAALSLGLPIGDQGLSPINTWELPIGKALSASPQHTAPPTQQAASVGIGDIRIRHAVNSRRDLEEFLASTAELAEGDVLLSDEKIPIMAHPPQTTSDLTFRDWITAIHRSEKMAKIDIKDPGAIPQIIAILKELKIDETQVIFNADIVEMTEKNLVTEEDLAGLRESFPASILSLGLAFGNYRLPDDPLPDRETFHRGVLELRDAANRLGGPVTFALLAPVIRPETVEALASTLEGRTLSFWVSYFDQADEAMAETLNRIAPHSFIDLIDAEGAPIRRGKPWDGARRREVRARTRSVAELRRWIEKAPDAEVLVEKGIAPVVAADLDGTLWRSAGLGPWVVSLVRERGMFTGAPRAKLDTLLSKLGIEPRHLPRPDKGVGLDFLRAWIAFVRWKKGRPVAQVQEMSREMEAMYGWVLAGIPVREIHRLVDEVVETQGLKDRVFEGVHALIHAVRRKGFTFAVITAGPEVIAQRFTEVVLGIPPEHTKGTRIGIKNGVLTTEVQRVAYREGKAEALREIIRQTQRGAIRLFKVLLTMGDSPHDGDSHLIPLGEKAAIPEPSQAAVDAGLEADNAFFLSYDKTEGRMIAGDFSARLR